MSIARKNTCIWHVLRSTCLIPLHGFQTYVDLHKPCRNFQESEKYHHCHIVSRTFCKTWTYFLVLTASSVLEESRGVTSRLAGSQSSDISVLHPNFRDLGPFAGAWELKASVSDGWAHFWSGTRHGHMLRGLHTTTRRRTKVCDRYWGIHTDKTGELPMQIFVL